MQTPGMDFFYHAKAVRLRGHHVKYLMAEDDEESVTQNRNGSSKNARWTLEYVPHNNNIIRLKSCYGKYLTASNHPFLLGMTGHKVLQTLPHTLDSSVEWEPIKDGTHVKLRTCHGNFLRANGGLPPWRNSITHDIPHRTATQDWVLWDVDVVEINVNSPIQELPSAPPLPEHDSNGFQSSVPSSPVGHDKSPSFFRQQPNDLKADTLPKMEGRTIYYHVAEESGEVSDEGMPRYSIIYNGNGVEELTHKFEEETGLEGIIVCSQSPLNGKLYPLRLQLPPHNVTMNVVLVLPFSKVAPSLLTQRGAFSSSDRYLELDAVADEPERLLLSKEKPIKFTLWVLFWATLSLAWFSVTKDANAAVDSIKASSFGLNIANSLRKLGWPDGVVVFSLATLPVLELRGAIPVGYWLKLNPLALTVLSIIGNMVPVPFIILYLKRFASFLAARNTFVSRFLDMLFENAKKKAGPVEEFQWLGLMLFVAVPFPGTGAWTGAIVASILDMPFWSAVSANFVGVVFAGLLVNLLVNLGMKYAIITGIILFFVSTFMWSILKNIKRSLRASN
ncbi:hypothetical protein TanjilG_15880 [Lupinus angustifolius]|uniref:Uncharacterized protein n=1 Tax=Lupinus angustifolius TaxID=3871 RepID=A0A4P1RH92_LUPAN|nr:hypothetical protein TanjilG_15880 [Lupinus angustifolius]